MVFTALGIGLAFGDSSTWIPFLVIGLTFLAVSGSMRTAGKRSNTKRPGHD